MALNARKGNLFTGQTDYSLKPIDWASLDFEFGTASIPMASCTSIKFGENAPKEKLYGKGIYAYGKGQKNADVYAECTIGTRELMKALNEVTFSTESMRKVQNIEAFNIIVKIDNYDGSYTIFTIYQCTIDKFDFEVKQNDPETYTTINLNPLNITYKIK